MLQLNSEEDITSDEFDNDTNAGWADSVAKVLKIHKPKSKKALVLSKAKTLNTTNTKNNKTELLGEQSNEKEHKRKKIKEVQSCRVKPVPVLERETEKKLQKIATKGIVQLFNVVKLQQKDVAKKLEIAGPLEVRKEKVLRDVNKKVFLDVLMGESIQNTAGSDINKSSNDSRTENDIWAPLRNDFMIDARLKDWDKEVNNEQEMELD